jgi:hypothetical protein
MLQDQAPSVTRTYRRCLANDSRAHLGVTRVTPSPRGALSVQQRLSMQGGAWLAAHAGLRPPAAQRQAAVFAEQQA